MPTAVTLLPSHRFWPCALLLAALSGCGGGAAADSLQPGASAGPGTSTGTTVGTGTGNGTTSTTGTTSTSTSTSTSTTDTLQPATSAVNPSETVGISRILGVGSSLAVLGLADGSPVAAATVSTAAPLRQFYVDSRLGDDGLDGLAATPGAGHGPWRTLARLQQAALRAGDSVQLACGSVWRETLRLASGADGSAALPIRIGAPEAGCSSAPAIDGSLALAAEAWQPLRGSIYQTTLASAPLQLLSAEGAGLWREAHHPNRGHLASDPTSPYLSLAEGSNSVVVDGRSVSTQLATGSSLVLPAGATLAGARLRVRTNAYIIDESPVSGFASGLISLGKPTTYPVQAGWGYFLIGQLWMLDSPGEWHYDSDSRLLSVWLPDSAAPGARVGVSTLATGVDLNGRQHVSLSGLAVRRTGLGLDLRNSTGITLRQAVVEDTADIGVHLAASQGALLEANQISRTGGNAIDGMGDPIRQATGLTVRNNLVRDSGVQLQGDNVLSLPRRTLAAIVGGAASSISGNTIVNAGYIGILAEKGSTVDGNVVYGACSVQDDCGGIYAGGLNADTRLTRNTVLHSRGMGSGLPAGSSTLAQGIYVDGPSSQLLVLGNTVVDADVGLQLHDASAVTVRDNRLFGNRRAQIWLQEDSQQVRPSGDVFGNTIDANQLAPTSASAVGLLMSSRYASSAGFGVFSANRYYDQASALVAVDRLPSGSRGYTMAEWQGSSGSGSTQAVDRGGQAVSQRTAVGMSINSANLIANASLASSSAGWAGWNQTAPAGSLSREACSPGWCLRYVAGGSAGVLSSPGFAVSAGSWYRLTLDVATEQDNQNVPLVLRAAGGNYAWASDRNLGFVAGRSWRRRSIVFQATQNLGPTATGANAGVSARVDIDGIGPGQSLHIANMELVAISPDPVSQLVGILVNAGGTALQAACPLTGAQAGGCGRYFTLADDQPVAWPLTVPGRSSVIVYAQSANASDSDGDGIADAIDRCPGTAAGAGVNAAGCSLAQP